MCNNKYLFLILLIISFFIFTQTCFASDINQTQNETVLNEQSTQTQTIFIISDNPGTNIVDSAAKELNNEGKISHYNIIARNGDQIKNMGEKQLHSLFTQSDAFIGEWISTDVDSVLTNLLGKYPELSDKKLFLILESPSGNLNSESSSLNLIKNNTINHNKIFSSLTNNEIIDYFKNTKRGSSYEEVNKYITNNGNKFGEIFNKLVLYKNLNDKENIKNQILYTLNLLGYNINYAQPTFIGTKNYGIYRDRWYTLEEYKQIFFKSSNKRTIGILESTMYVSSQQLHPTYSIIQSLEAKGYNVIPVFAAGGSAEQLKVMVESWTSAGSDIKGFLNNPSKYDSYVDAIVSMVAYGVGGENFTKATEFFEKIGVPVFRAVHSDYVSNEMWELGSTGLTTEKSDKWWHITIAETQGIIDATFVGGQSSYISNLTGASIVTYIPHERNINLLTDRIDSWVDLKYTSNKDKLISIIYYNYPPGKQNIGSSYLDTITSIYNILKTLKKEGYNVGTLPSSVGELENLMLKTGINVANWAPGELEKLANQPGVVLLSVKEYTKWYNSLDEIVKIQVSKGPVAYIGELSKRAVELNYTVTIGDTIDDWFNQVVALLPSENIDKSKTVLTNIVNTLKQYTLTKNPNYYNQFLQYFKEFQSLNIQGLNGWGEAPGDVMVVKRNGEDYFVIPGLTYGNVFIAPEPQRGWESDIENLYHCTAVAPTHQYLAAYYYMQTKYPNAMIFTGRHATHEWLPGKEILLSATDYGSVVVGDVPQLYFYIVDGLGEAIQAKRRGFAVIISHLTSPMSYTHLYGNLTELAKLMENPNQDNIKKARELIIKNDYSTNMGLSKEEVLNINSDLLINKINIFLTDVQSTLYPLGLHALGQSWSENDLISTVSAMLSYNYTLDNQVVLNLFTELSKAYYSKSYSQLQAFQRENILNKSQDIIKALIKNDVNSVYNLCISQNSNLKTQTFLECLKLGKKYIDLIDYSVKNELQVMINGLNGKYVPVGEGGEIVVKPSVLPTGTNMFQDQSSELPTMEAWDYSKTLALLTLNDLNDTTEKILMGIWCVETARDDGALVSTVLRLLGMKPIWTDSSSAGYDDEGNPTGKKVSAMPEIIELDDLTRPDGWMNKRIDVSVITSGLFRDLYSSQAILLDNAYRVALARSYATLMKNKQLMTPELIEALEGVMESINYYGISNEALETNYVAQHWIEDTLYYLSIGYNATYAGECAITRIFAPPNGDYGAGISKLVSMSWTWNDTSELADFYLGRMGNMYSKNYWGDTNPVVFLRALSNSDTIVASRNTNQYGVLDNDDFFDYWGGLSMTVEEISGKSPKFNVLMYANKNTPYISSLEEVMYNEISSRYDNPEWIKGMMQEGYSGARYMSNKFVSNLHGWQITRPAAVTNDLWNRVYDTYYKDKYGIGVNEWLKSGNNAYSLISMSGTMLTTIHDGYWDASDATVRDIANTWAQATVQNGVACCDCSCGNIAMMQWAVQYVNPDILAQLLPKLYEATKNPVFANNTQNVPAESENSNQEASTQNPGQGSTAMANAKANSTSSSQAMAQNGESQGEAFSNVGQSSQSAQAGSSSSQGADVKKAVEINPITSQSASEVGLSIIAVIAILCLIMVVAVGYFRDNDKKYNQNLDELFNQKIGE